uniref:Anaphylatoxin-like domain-containing protein n=1 Tax=Stegastes partitus TaxID=144197 RepID=A0A3B5B3U4_9TELE
ILQQKEHEVQYDDELQRDCCLDGMRETPVSYTCERRSEYVLDGAGCVMAFLNCCREMERLRDEKREEGLQLARSKRREQGLGGGSTW